VDGAGIGGDDRRGPGQEGGPAFEGEVAEDGVCPLGMGLKLPGQSASAGPWVRMKGGRSRQELDQIVGVQPWENQLGDRCRASRPWACSRPQADLRRSPAVRVLVVDLESQNWASIACCSISWGTF